MNYNSICITFARKKTRRGRDRVCEPKMYLPMPASSDEDGRWKVHEKNTIDNSCGSFDFF